MLGLLQLLNLLCLNTMFIKFEFTIDYTVSAQFTQEQLITRRSYNPVLPLLWCYTETNSSNRSLFAVVLIQFLNTCTSINYINIQV